MTQIGQCKLCLSQKELMDSHFLPASIYKVCRDTAKGHNPIAVSQGIAKYTTDQLTDYVFCRDCEKRLNDNGEAWVHTNMARPEGFFIHDALDKVAPEGGTDDFAVYAGGAVSGLDMDRLSYFGLSVFWRGAVHRWPPLNPGEPRIEKLPLNENVEPIRLFLLNGAPVPRQISLLIWVWPCKVGQPPLMFHTPVMFTAPAGKRDQDGHEYRFYIPGLCFQLLVGKGISPDLHRMSALTEPERYIYRSEAVAALMMKPYDALIRESIRIGKLAHEFPSKK